MHFVTTINGLNVALAAIETWRIDGEIVRVETNRNDNLQVDLGVWQRVQGRLFSGVVPAAPGTYFLTSVSHEDGSWSWDEDLVIAWGINVDGYSVGIGTDEVDYRERAILLPSGKVVGPGGEWASKEAYIRDQDGT